MLEAQAHTHLKNILQRSSSSWPHSLTLSRLVARSLRRRDKTLIRTGLYSKNSWWLGALIPLCLNTERIALVMSSDQRRYLFDIELPRLKKEGLNLPCIEGSTPPLSDELWIMDFSTFVKAFTKNQLKLYQLIFPEAEKLTYRLRKELSIVINKNEWDKLIRANPSYETHLINSYDQLSRKFFTFATCKNAIIKLDDFSEIFRLKDLLMSLDNLFEPWSLLADVNNFYWASWIQLDSKMLSWDWHFQPIQPLLSPSSILKNNPYILLSGSSQECILKRELHDSGSKIDVEVTLNNRSFKDPLPLFAPKKQPLPNTSIYSNHLLQQSRRLILGCAGLTLVLLDDDRLRRKLTAELASEFGKRVVHETTAPETNGVVCARWSWWLNNQEKLPLPHQLIVALLPLGSLSEPLISSQVDSFKRQGRDWFRELLLPQALEIVPKALLPMRENSGRIAILDGRLYSRSWGEHFLKAIEPWIPLHRLLPN